MAIVSHKNGALLIVLCLLTMPLASAGQSSWTTSSPVNPGDEGVTVNSFTVPSNETITDAWIHVTNDPMANDQANNLFFESNEIEDGSFSGTTASLIDGNITLEDDGSTSSVFDFDDNGNFTIDLSSQYISGPGPHMWALEESGGWITSACPGDSANGGAAELRQYNITSGYDDDLDGYLESHEVNSVLLFCQTDQVIVGGSGLPPAGDVNGTVRNSTPTFNSMTLNSGHSVCSEGGYYLEYGNDFGTYYDRNSSLNASELGGELYFCNQIELWFATLLDFGGSIQGAQQQLSHGTVPAAPSEGEVVAGTLPGSPVPPGSDGWLITPTQTIPVDPTTHVNYTLTFDHWRNLESGDGAWVEYRIQSSSGDWTNWTWVAPVHGYPNYIPVGDINVEGNPSGDLPVFGGTSTSWENKMIDLASLTDGGDDTYIQFRFRLSTSDSSSGSPGWFIDNITYNNDGTGSGAWHHGCDVNGYSYTNYGTYCYYSNSALGYLNVATGLDLTGVYDLRFDLHWDLEGSGWDNACIELSNNGGTSWIDISSTSSTTTTQCRSRAGSIPNYGYTDITGTSYGDDSGGMVTIENDVPASHRVSSVDLRIVVQTDASVAYGSPGGASDPDGREGLTVFGYRTMSSSGTVMQSYTIPSTASTSGYSYASGPNEWRFLTLTSGFSYENMNFEDSSVSAPEVADVDGFTRTGSRGTSCSSSSCGWELGPVISSTFGPEEATSFPYLYRIGATGSFDGTVSDAALVSPVFSVPESGITFLEFDQWICWNYDHWSYGDMRGGALWIQVDGGAWQHVDPGYNWYTETMATYSSGTLYIPTVNDGLPIWANTHCGNSDMSSYEVSLQEWAGSDVRFKWSASQKYQYATNGGSGWFIDNVGFREAYFDDGGSWVSEPIAVGGTDDFNLGIIEIEGTFDDNSTIAGTLLNANSLIPITGFENLDFPINLAGLDTQNNPSVRLVLSLDTLDHVSTPIVKKITIGNERILSVDLLDFNGWSMSNGIEVVNGTLNATAIAGTITSEYIQSIRPINRILFQGNSSNNVLIDIFDENGVNLGQGVAGGYMSFNPPIMGYSAQVTLPTNGYIEELVLKVVNGEPGRDMVIDVGEDGTTDWAFPSSEGRGHYGWQTHVLLDTPSTNPSVNAATSVDLSLYAGVSEAVVMLIPDGAIVNSGLLSITSDSDGFEAPVTLDVNGYSSSTSNSDTYISYLDFSPNQAASITAMGSSWTDTSSNRDWKEVSLYFQSSVSQVVTLSRIAVSYNLMENVSGLATTLSNYQTQAVADQPTLTQVNIPTNISAAAGQVMISGLAQHELLITNKDFNVPNKLHPGGFQYEIITKHRHLFDNSELTRITLDGLASDGEEINFQVETTEAGDWSNTATFSQTSGSSQVIFNDSASSVAIVDGGDGWMEIEVTWKFEITWNWDDVDRIDWTANSFDNSGYSMDPATAVSGRTGNAVENDLQIDSFEIKDQFDRSLSNQFSPFYPFPIAEGSALNITGTVRFQDTTDMRPNSDDFKVRVDISGDLYLLDSNDDGTFSGIINSPVGYDEITASPELFRVGPLSGSIGGQDVSGVTSVVTMLSDTHPPVVNAVQVNTATGLVNANGKVWDPTVPLTLYVTIEEAEARGESLTLKYWRADVDDLNGNGMAEEDEYLSQIQLLSAGMTGEQQVTFDPIDVSSQGFNSPVHVYLEGTDWAGLSYQDGGTGGSAGADNAWSSLIIATDEPTSTIRQGYSIDSETGFLLAGHNHVMRMQINEANGLNSLDNITVMLCGDEPDEIGKFSYNPSEGTIWTASESFVNPISVQTTPITDEVFEVSFMFELSWYYPWTEGQQTCKPSVRVVDDFTEVAFDNNIGELSWLLDNQLVAVTTSVEDLSPPFGESGDLHVYLRQGDELSVSGEVYYASSGVAISTIDDDLMVDVEIVYGTQSIIESVDVSDEGTWMASMVLPMRAPSNPEMDITTTVVNVPGVGTSANDNSAQVTVDSVSPTVLFDLINYPDSSLTILESDLIEEVLVTVTVVDSIGMPTSDLEVSWVFLRDNLPVSGTEGSGALPLILNDVDSNSDGIRDRDIFQGKIDFTPGLVDFEVEEGDRILFWVTSTDRAGNNVQGPGSEDSPRTVALRLMVFTPKLDSMVITPQDPFSDQEVTIETFWSNSGKRDGTIEITLFELKSDGNWRAESSSIELDIPAESSSNYAKFTWQAGEPGQPILYVIIDGDLDNPCLECSVNGIIVKPTVSASDSDGETLPYMVIAGIALVAIALVGFFVSRSRTDDDEYYYDDDDDYYYDDVDEEFDSEEE